jgi:hypothetical protein
MWWRFFGSISGWEGNENFITPKFDFTVVAIQESKYVSATKIEKLQSSLEAHELLVIERGAERTMQ